MCLNCGKITDWRVESLLMPRHIVVGLLLLLVYLSGLLYWIAVCINRADEKNRNKICPACGAKNMWSFIY